MNGTDNNFERELRGALSNLADDAPPSPSYGSVIGRLRRRNAFRRLTRTGLAAACFVVACGAVWFALAGPGDLNSDTPNASHQAQPSKPLAQLPRPLPVNAPPKQIESALRQCFASSNVKSNIVVTRDHGQSLSFCATGKNIESIKLHTELTRLLEQFDSVRINMIDGRLGYMLAAEPNT